MTSARVIRGEVLKVREMEYVIGCLRRSAKISRKVMFLHILPNVISSGIVLAAIQVGVTILAESSFIFPRPGRQTAYSDLGLDAGRRENLYQQRLVDDDLYPGIAITITVLGRRVFLGDWLRDFLDPNVRGRA